MKKLAVLPAFLILAACGSRTVKVLDAPWVSMKQTEPPAPGAKLTKVGHVEEEYCQTSWSGSYGLMDEVVKQAEKKYQIDYIRNASITQSVNKSCAQLSGDGYRLN